MNVMYGVGVKLVISGASNILVGPKVCQPFCMPDYLFGPILRPTSVVLRLASWFGVYLWPNILVEQNPYCYWGCILFCQIQIVRSGFC